MEKYEFIQNEDGDIIYAEVSQFKNQEEFEEEAAKYMTELDSPHVDETYIVENTIAGTWVLSAEGLPSECCKLIQDTDIEIRQIYQGSVGVTSI